MAPASTLPPAVESGIFCIGFLICTRPLCWAACHTTCNAVCKAVDAWASTQHTAQPGPQGPCGIASPTCHVAVYVCAEVEAVALHSRAWKGSWTAQLSKP